MAQNKQGSGRDADAEAVGKLSVTVVHGMRRRDHDRRLDPGIFRENAGLVIS
jgi:hypothetical protein